MNNMQELSLVNVNGGIVLDLAEEEIAKILEDIADPNKKAESVRELTIKVKFTPNKTRSGATVEVISEAKLGKREAVVGSAAFELGKDGKVKAYPEKDLNQPDLEHLQFNNNAKEA
jgi:hypothetical protein